MPFLRLLSSYAVKLLCNAGGAGLPRRVRQGGRRARCNRGRADLRAHAYRRAAQGTDPIRHRRPSRRIEAGRGARPRVGHSAKAVLQRRRCGEGRRASVRDRSRPVRNRAVAGAGTARASDRASRPGAARRGAIEASGTGPRGEPQGIRRRDIVAAARGSGDSTGQRVDQAGRAESLVYARIRAAGRHHRTRRAFDRHADHDRCQWQPADDDQPGQPRLGSLQPGRGGSGQAA